MQGAFQPNMKQIAHFLIIENVTKADGGYYTCAATNRIGSDIQAIHLIVIGKLNSFSSCTTCYSVIVFIKLNQIV